MYYKIKIGTSDDILNYSFILLSDKVYYYTQKGITTYHQNVDYNFKILFGYASPVWAKKSICYQIFVDRFNKSNLDDFDLLKNNKIVSWDSIPVDYNLGRCSDFYGGNLKGISEKITYLRNLGVNTICLSPVFSSSSTHKYNVDDFFNVDYYLGGELSLKHLSEIIHNNNMKLILDIPISYTSCKNHWFKKHIGGKYDGFYLYYGKMYKGFMENRELPVLNFENEKVREVIYRDENSALKKWISHPYDIDGIKFISASSIFAGKGLDGLNINVWNELNKALKKAKKDLFIIGEMQGDGSSYLMRRTWDSSTNYIGFTSALRAWMVVNDLDSNCYEFSVSDFSNQLMEVYSKLPWVMQQTLYNYIDSVDCSRLHNNEIVENRIISAVIILFCIIGLPCIYYGDEIELDERVDKKEGCRYPMDWEHNYEDNSIYNLYKKLCVIRKEEELIDGGFKIVHMSDEIFSFARFSDKRVYFVICTQNNTSTSVNINVGVFEICEINKINNLLNNEIHYEFNKSILSIQVVPNESYLFFIDI